jgi:hypothetical protein
MSELAFEHDGLDAAVDEAIAECGGNMRDAMRELIAACRYLEAARERALDMVSRGYVRGYLPDQSADLNRG